MSLRLRPRFSIRVDATPDAIMQRLTTALQEDGTMIRGEPLSHQYELFMRAEHRHFWSPFLNILLFEEGDETLITGQFGPNVNVWTLFLAGYAVLGLTGSVGLVVGWSQYTIGQEATGLALTVACLGLSFVLYVAGKIGERLAGPQIETLLFFARKALGVDIELD